MSDTKLYTAMLLEHARRPRNASLPDSATLHAQRHNPLCGDRIRVGVQLTAGAIDAVGFEAQGCAICVASASVMTELTRAASRDDVDALRRLAMEAAEGRLGEVPLALACFGGVAEFPSRKPCVMLAWDALIAALDGEAAATPSPPLEPAPAIVSDPTCALTAALLHLDRGEPVAVATLVGKAGASPCPLGSRLTVAADGSMTGSVSGGCVESAVVRLALSVIADGRSRRQSYGLATTDPASVGLPCGSSIDVVVARLEDARPVRQALDAKRMRRACAIRTHRHTGCLRVVDELEPSTDDAAFIEGDELVEPCGALPKLILVGAVHIAQHLATMASRLGFAVHLVDPRDALATSARFPDVRIHHAHPGDVLPSLLDRHSALVTLTHDAKLDDPALRCGLASDAFYIGALGSRKTHRERRERLAQDGAEDPALDRIHGPAGVHIGARGAPEIALSILAEIVETRRLGAERGRIGTLILAAGLSRRFGPDNKLLADVYGQPMIRHAVRAAVDADVGPVVVVLGHDAEATRRALVDLPARFVMNARYAEGMGTSIAAGIGSLAEESDCVAAMVLPGDMPCVEAAHLRRMAARFGPGTRHHILVAEGSPAQPDVPWGHPVLFPKRYFDELRALSGEAGGKTVIRRHAGAVLRVSVEEGSASESVTLDVDTKSELARARVSEKPGARSRS